MPLGRDSCVIRVPVCSALMVILQTPWLLLAYFIDAPALLVPLLVGAVPRKEIRQMLFSVPAFFVLRLVNGYYFLEAIWSEWLLKRSALVYEKGH